LCPALPPGAACPGFSLWADSCSQSATPRGVSCWADSRAGPRPADAHTADRGRARCHCATSADENVPKLYPTCAFGRGGRRWTFGLFRTAGGVQSHCSGVLGYRMTLSHWERAGVKVAAPSCVLTHASAPAEQETCADTVAPGALRELGKAPH